jgi:hypothetical protein
MKLAASSGCRNPSLPCPAGGRSLPRETSTVTIHEQAFGIAQAAWRNRRRRGAVNQRLIDLARIMLR